MASYDSFAKIYDQVMGTRQHNIDRILGYLEEYKPDAKSVLELGSGTGSILKGLTPKFKATGIELSKNMLEIAREKVPAASLYQGDMVSFELDQVFDVVICIYDTINHLKEYEKWEKLFKRIDKNLSPGGLFIFDINTLGRLQRLAREGVIRQEHSNIGMEMKVVRVSDREVTWDIELIEKQSDGRDHHALETIFEAAFPVAQIIDSLTQYFEIEEMIGSHGEKASDEVDKVFFVCKKRSL